MTSITVQYIYRRKHRGGGGGGGGAGGGYTNDIPHPRGVISYTRMIPRLLTFPGKSLTHLNPPHPGVWGGVGIRTPQRDPNPCLDTVPPSDIDALDYTEPVVICETELNRNRTL